MKPLAKSALVTLTLVVVAAFLASPASAARRALLIGISSYESIHSLDNPGVDVVRIEDVLSKADYVTTVVKTAPETERLNLLSVIDKFLNTIDVGDDVFVYYSGHGVDINGENMLVPSDAPDPNGSMSAFSLAQRLIPMRPLISQIADRDPAMQVWVVDACRSNPYAAGGRPFATSGGLSKIEQRPGTFIVFSASYLQVALDRLPGEPDKSGLGSPFSRTFAALFNTWKDQDIELFIKNVRRDVTKLVEPNPQFPVYENGVLDQWCFVNCKTGPQKIAVSSSTTVPEPAVQKNSVIMQRYKDQYKLVITKPDEHRSASEAPDDYAKVFGTKAAVFLGKESSITCKNESVSDLYPFGCNVLQKLSAHFKDDKSTARNGLVGAVLTAVTDVNVRLGLPAASDKGAVYGCKVRTLKKGEKVNIVATAALQYAGDTFYWGVTDAREPKCAS